MKIYKTIIWFSVLLVIGEIYTLSGFEFIPIGAEGQVLGETTNIFWEEIIKQHYPASYYSAQTIESIVAQGNEEAAGEVADVPNTTTVPSGSVKDESNGSSQEDLNKMIELLNVPHPNGLFLFEPAETNNLDNRVNTLINKNKRVYLKDLKKELEEIREGFDY